MQKLREGHSVLRTPSSVPEVAEAGNNKAGFRRSSNVRVCPLLRTAFNNLHMHDGAAFILGRKSAPSMTKVVRSAVWVMYFVYPQSAGQLTADRAPFRRSISMFIARWLLEGVNPGGEVS